MTKLLETIVDDVPELPPDEQDRIAHALLRFLDDWQEFRAI